jgi:hypothetical protein
MSSLVGARHGRLRRLVATRNRERTERESVFPADIALLCLYLRGKKK